ncbi:MAG: hypothetical protein JST93_27010 [Acidobacteria bacterium]|nr:hypothetical protein [Acidobacteriota bacterium]
MLQQNRWHMNRPRYRSLAGGLLFLLVGVAPAQINNITVTSAASFEIGLPGPGSLASIFCTGLPSIEGTVKAAGFPLPRELAGITVMVGGASAPILAVAAGNGFQQINIQVPLEPLQFTMTGVLVAVRAGTSSGTREVSLSITKPGEFFRIPGDPRLGEGNKGIFQHASDYSLVTEENPAKPGEIVIAYLTGIPLRTVPEVPTGEAAPLSPPALVPRLLHPITDERIISFFSIRFGDNPTTSTTYSVPSFLGLTPGLAGVFQANFTIPASWDRGTTRIVLTREMITGISGNGRFEATYSTPVVIPIARSGTFN